MLVTEALRKGDIASQGRRVGKVEFNDLSPDFWLRARIVHDPAVGPLFRVTTYEPGRPDVNALVRRYDGFRLDGNAVLRLWPETAAAE